MSESPQYLARPDGSRLAFRRSPGRGPGVVFLGGYASDMEGSKALALEAACRAADRAFLRFDYQGHGASSGAFEEGTIGIWAGDAIAAVDELTEGPQVLVGSSMGGWIMLLVQRALPGRVAGLVGIAAAPDFTEDLMWPAFDETQRRALREDGKIVLASEYSEDGTVVTQALLEDGKEHLVLREPIAFQGPARLLHGMRDPDVPWQTSLTLAERLASEDVEVILDKAGDHRLSEPDDLERLARTVLLLAESLED